MSDDCVNLYFKDKQDDREIMKMLNNNQKKIISYELNK